MIPLSITGDTKQKNSADNRW